MVLSVTSFSPKWPSSVSRLYDIAFPVTKEKILYFNNEFDLAKAPTIRSTSSRVDGGNDHRSRRALLPYQINNRLFDKLCTGCEGYSV